MTKGIVFWMLMILWMLFGLLTHFHVITWPHGPFISGLLLWVLLGLLGWQVFWPMIK